MFFSKKDRIAPELTLASDSRGLQESVSRQANSGVAGESPKETSERSAPQLFLANPDVTQDELFQHPPLATPKTEIRLLELQPGTGDQEIRCKLRVCDRTNLPEYSAISYTWGDTRGTRYVRIDGKILAVGENCWIALQQVRMANHPRWVWIDAISINQHDGNEKNHQVQEMAKVYENAKCVLVSLGMGAYDTDYLFEWANELYYLSESSEPRPRQIDRSETWRDLVAAGPSFIRSRDWVLNWFDKIGPDGFQRFTNILTHLGRHSYWQRMWVQPELAFARDALLFFGHGICRISIIKVVFFVLDGWASEKPGMSRRFAVSKTMRNVTSLLSLPMKQTLEKLSTANINQRRAFFGGFRFEELSKLQCSEPRDRIFAVLPLVDWQRFEMSALSVDYERSAFSLAEECVPFCTDFWDVKFLLKCLEIDCEDTQRELSYFLGTKASLPLVTTPRPSDLDICQCGPDRSLNSLSFHSFYYCRVLEDSMEVLPNGHKVIKHSSNDGPADQVFGYVPNATVSGDVILSVQIGKSGSPSAGLIIRKDVRGIYEFVGQAVLTNDLHHYSHYPSGFELRLDPRDAMAFAIHSSNHSAFGQSITQDWLCSRLDTPFTASRYSSYAVEYDDTISSDDRYNLAYISSREPAKTKDTICINCGRYLPSAASSRTDSGAHAVDTAAAATQINSREAIGRTSAIDIHEAILDFTPSMHDELPLRRGQFVRLIISYDDGWALCMHMDRTRQGVCPRTCLSKQPLAQADANVTEAERNGGWSWPKYLRAKAPSGSIKSDEVSSASAHDDLTEGIMQSDLASSSVGNIPHGPIDTPNPVFTLSESHVRRLKAAKNRSHFRSISTGVIERPAQGLLNNSDLNTPDQPAHGRRSRLRTRSFLSMTFDKLAGDRLTRRSSPGPLLALGSGDTG